MNWQAIKSRIAPSVCEVLLASKLHRLGRPRFGGIGHILNLHRVRPRSTRPRLASVAALEVTPQWLDHSISWYRDNGFEVVSLDDVHAMLHRHAPTRPFVAYTFDDGFEDNYSVALPIFEKHNAPFAVYLAAGFPDGKMIPWWQLLEDLILANSSLHITLAGEDLFFDCSSEAGREAALYNLRTRILNSCRTDYRATLQATFEPFGIDIHRYSADGMTWDQARDMARCPLVTIGAHTVSHRCMAFLPPAEMVREIVESRDIISARIGQAVEHFAYPYGTRADASHREFLAVRGARFKTAVTTRPANIFPQHHLNAFCLPRNLISGEREGANSSLLSLWTNGAIPALENRFQQVVTD